MANWQQEKEAFKREFNKGLHESLLAKTQQELQQGLLKGTLVTPHQHPEFFASLDGLAKRAGLGYSPIMVLSDAPLVQYSWLEQVPNAAALPGRRLLLVNKQLMQLTGASLHAPVSPKLETLLAHELSHLKHDLPGVIGTRLSIMAFPLVAVMGLHLYDRARHTTPRAPEETESNYKKRLADGIDNAAGEEKKALLSAESLTFDQQQWRVEKNWWEKIVNAGRYAAAAAVGVGAALWLARRTSLAREFHADKFAAEVTGNPEILKSVLVDIHKEAEKLIAAHPAPDSIGKSFNEYYHDILVKTVDAHPSLRERLAFIDKVAQQRQTTTALQV